MKPLLRQRGFYDGLQKKDIEEKGKYGVKL
jgi:hypothetical protein